MTQEQLIEQFLNGETTGKAGNLHIEGSLLVHYNTAIAERLPQGFVFNNTRYSLVTGKIQKMFRSKANEKIIKTSLSVKEGTTSSLSEHLASRDDEAKELEPLLVIEHNKFGRGEVVSCDADSMTVLFSGVQKTLVTPLVVEHKVIKVLEGSLDEVLGVREEKSVEKVNSEKGV